MPTIASASVVWSADNDEFPITNTLKVLRLFKCSWWSMWAGSWLRAIQRWCREWQNLEYIFFYDQLRWTAEFKVRHWSFLPPLSIISWPVVMSMFLEVTALLIMNAYFTMKCILVKISNSKQCIIFTLLSISNKKIYYFNRILCTWL